MGCSPARGPEALSSRRRRGRAEEAQGSALDAGRDEHREGLPRADEGRRRRDGDLQDGRLLRSRASACRPTSVAPRSRMGLRAPIVVWTDDHELDGHEHAYSVMLDDVGHPTSAPRDVTPEASEVWRPSLLAAADRTAMLYWDKSGRESGVRVALARLRRPHRRRQHPRGRRPRRHFWPAFEKHARGLRRRVAGRPRQGGQRSLPPQAESRARAEGPRDPADRLQSRVPRARPSTCASRAWRSRATPSSSSTSSSATRRTSSCACASRSTPRSSTGGLEEITAGQRAGSRRIASSATRSSINEDKLPARRADPSRAAPRAASSRGTASKSGALRRPHRARAGQGPLAEELRAERRPPVARRGRRGPGHAVAGSRRAPSAWRPSRATAWARRASFAKTSAELPRPWIAPGKTKGEWLVAWKDFEGRHSEVFAAKLQCP